MKVAKLIFSLGVIAAATSFSTAVLADSNGHNGHHHKGTRHSQAMPMQRMLGKVKLTEEQREQVKQLVQQHRVAHKEQRIGNTERKQLRELIEATQFDAVAVRQLLEQQQSARLEQRVARMELRHQILQVLTDEQRLQMAEQKSHWQQRKSQRKQS
ncbi:MULTISPECIES: Spy/CpxP family protein refolding chaperone [Rheinheimera]|uniref:Spy/CpxP family protein refolding chaperone n=1 Tax=Rheinheimera TaxID=67575 RepID=UPI00104C1A19|nr:Spy/CpxP family protein refolding chaperone [Rheinheimera sp. D18]QBL10133.1 periplasmic heavy metal sensor [Rheinheimera sp. D18]